MTNPGDDERYTLEQLSERVARRVAAAGIAQGNGQVSAVPDARTLRYYTSAGLMDRPVEVRDRRALYTERHVDQVVAIKRLQAAGHPLSAIQGMLAGLTPAALRQVSEGRRPKGGRAAGRAFWSQAPTAPKPDANRPRSRPPTTSAVSGVALSDAVTVLFPTPPRPLDDDDTAALADAARPLLDELARRGLIGPSRKEAHDD